MHFGSKEIFLVPNIKKSSAVEKSLCLLQVHPKFFIFLNILIGKIKLPAIKCVLKRPRSAAEH